MAESQRKAESMAPAVDDAAQARHDQLTLLFFLFGGIAIVAGMFWIAGFLSRGDGDSILNPPLYIFGGAGVVAAIIYFITKQK